MKTIVADNSILPGNRNHNLFALYKIHWLWALGFYSGVMVVLTWPLPLNFTTKVPGVLVEDRLQNMWNLWWIKEAVFSFKNPFLTDKLFYPYYSQTELPLLYHTLQLFNGLISLPAQLWSLVAAYNLIVFFSFITSGFGMYLLGRQLGGSFPAALLGGTIFAFSPPHLSNISESITNIMSQEFIPFFALFLHAAGQAEGKSRLKPSVAAAITLALCAYNDWYITAYLIFYAGFYGAWRWLYGLRLNWKWLWSRFYSALLVVAPPVMGGLILAAPLLIPLLLNLNDPRFVLQLGYDREIRSSVALFSLFKPLKTNNAWLTYFLGYVPLALGLAALVIGWRKRKSLAGTFWKGTFYWAMLVIGSLLLALGPELKIENQDPSSTTGIPMPYKILRLLPLVSISRAPGRFVILAVLGLACLAVLGLARLEFRPRLEAVLAGACVLALLVEIAPWPMALNRVEPNPFFQKIAGEPGRYSVLEIPITRHYNSDHYRMLNQTAYGQPVMGGYLSRPIIDPYCDGTTDFKVVCDLRNNLESTAPQNVDPTTRGAALQYLLRINNFKFVAIYKSDYKGRDPAELKQAREMVENQLGPKALIYEDDTLTGYRVPLALLADDPPPGLYLDKGWFTPDYSRDAKTFYRWTREEAIIIATNTRPNSLVRLGLQVVDSQGGPRDIQVLVEGKLLTQFRVEKTRQPQQFSFEAQLPVGRAEIRFRNLQPAGPFPDNSPRRVGIAVSLITIVALN